MATRTPRKGRISEELLDELLSGQGCGTLVAAFLLAWRDDGDAAETRSPAPGANDGR